MSTTTTTKRRKLARPLLHQLPPGLVRALNHDIRVRILDTMGRHLEPISPTLLSIAMKEDVGNVSYHVGVLLRDCGVVELVHERPVRGAVEHFYQRTAAMVKWHTEQDVLATIATVIGDDVLTDDQRLQAVGHLVAIAATGSREAS